MGNSCMSKHQDRDADAVRSSRDSARSQSNTGKSNGHSNKRNRMRRRPRGRKRGSSVTSLGSPRPTELSMDSVYFDARDTMSENGLDGPGRMSRGSSYQDGIDDYPNSPSGSSSPRHYLSTLSQDKAAQLAADADALLEPEEPPAACLPRILSSKEQQSKTFVRLMRPVAGSSLRGAASGRAASVSQPLPHAVPEHAVPEGAPAPGSSLLPSPSGRLAPSIDRWEDPPGEQFLVRGADYAKTRKKVPSAAPIYRLLDVDAYSFDFKLSHIAKHVQLPAPPTLPSQAHLPREDRLPPLIVVNMQMPDYPASLFGGRYDGPGCSLIYYFALPDGWTPDQEPNQAALGLLRRMVHDGQESDGSASRERLKLIPRVFNVEEWAKTAPLSGTEQALLRRYNDKPLLTRPQQRFFLTPEYLEIDLDVHNYAYLARKAFAGFTNRLMTVVFDNAFVVQGNRPEELPEQLFAAARLYYPDLPKVRPFPADLLEHLRDGDGSSSAGSAAGT